MSRSSRSWLRAVEPNNRRVRIPCRPQKAPPDDGFVQIASLVFGDLRAELVDFSNVWTGGTLSNTVYRVSASVPKSISSVEPDR